MNDNEIMAQVLAVFYEEQAEHRQAAGELLLELERTPDHPQRQTLLDRLFREAHSLKGGARAAGQPEIEQIAHRIEDLFSAVRQGHCQLTPGVCDPVYAALDAIGVLMDQVSAGQAPDLAPYQALLATLGHILDEPESPPELSAESQPSAAKQRKTKGRRQTRHAEQAANGHDLPATSTGTPNTPSVSPNRQAPNGSPGGDVPKENGSATVRLPTAMLDDLLNESGELTTCAVGLRQQARYAREIADLPMRWRRIWRQTQPILGRRHAPAPTIRPTIHYLKDRDEQLPRDDAHGGDPDTFMLADALNQANTLIADLERRLALHAYQMAACHTQLQAVSDRLRQQVRRTRMLAVTTLFSPLRLQLREMARVADKQVVLDVDDGGAEADRQVLERLNEVLLHLLCNAVDHGIEPSALRLANGKPAQGLITLRAEVSGDRLTLLVADDGAGLDLAAIRQRALTGGQWSEADLERMSEADLIDLIFLPSFSTRTTVSTLSGRGVGLDIVRSRVERMHGHVAVRSAPGAGCTFTISLPLSLTSSHGLLLRAGKTVYALPLDSVQRIIPVAARDICLLEGRLALLVDDRPLALAHLTDLLEPQPTSSADDPASTRYGLLIGSDERQAVCLVDAVLGEQELVVHRLPAPLQQVHYIAGATILADGTVVPILDMADLLRAALGARRPTQPAPASSGPARRTTALVVDDSITTRTLEKNILEAAGYLVHLATDGIEALQVLDQLADAAGCDLILSDVDMPRLDGFDLTAQVRADPRFRHLPVVLVTSLDTAGDRERGIAAGADAYIVKRQFDQQILLDTIERLI